MNASLRGGVPPFEGTAAWFEIERIKGGGPLLCEACRVIVGRFFERAGMLAKTCASEPTHSSVRFRAVQCPFHHLRETGAIREQPELQARRRTEIRLDDERMRLVQHGAAEGGASSSVCSSKASSTRASLLALAIFSPTASTPLFGLGLSFGNDVRQKDGPKAEEASVLAARWRARSLERRGHGVPKLSKLIRCRLLERFHAEDRQVIWTEGAYNFRAQQID